MAGRPTTFSENILYIVHEKKNAFLQTTKESISCNSCFDEFEPHLHEEAFFPFCDQNLVQPLLSAG